MCSRNLFNWGGIILQLCCAGILVETLACCINELVGGGAIKVDLFRMCFTSVGALPGYHKACQIGSSEQRVLLQPCVAPGVQGACLAYAFLCPLC